jgi:hypothetical protein
MRSPTGAKKQAMRMQQRVREALLRWAGIQRLGAVVLVGTAMFGGMAVLGGCKGKISQCNVLIGVINVEGKKIPKMSMKDPSSFEKAADSFEKTAKLTAGVELEDEKLIGFRDEYTTMLDDLAKATRGIVAARDSKDPVKIKQANEKMETFKKREGDYLERLNAYCSGS